MRKLLAAALVLIALCLIWPDEAKSIWRRFFPPSADASAEGALPSPAPAASPSPSPKPGAWMWEKKDMEKNKHGRSLELHP